MTQTNTLIQEKGGAEMDSIKKECPKCGKVIESLYENQLDYNYKAHLISCNKKKSTSETTNAKQ